MFFCLMLLMDVLLSKGMSNIYYWQKLTFSKPRFSGKENLKKCTSFEEQKGTSYIRGNVYFGILVYNCLSSTKLFLRFLLTCFSQEIKGFYQSFLGSEVDFTDIMNVSPYILAKNKNFKKLRRGFVDERAIITMTLISSFHPKTLVPFCLWNKDWKHIFNTNSELSQNRTEKLMRPFKTKINWQARSLEFLRTGEISAN